MTLILPAATQGFLKIGRKREIARASVEERLAREHAVGNLVKVRERAMRNLFDEVRTLRDLEEIFSSKELQNDDEGQAQPEIPAVLFDPKNKKRQAKTKETQLRPLADDETQGKHKGKNM